jgi:hypothetical protein
MSVPGRQKDSRANDPFRLELPDGRRKVLGSDAALVGRPTLASTGSFQIYWNGRFKPGLTSSRLSGLPPAAIDQPLVRASLATFSPDGE